MRTPSSHAQSVSEDYDIVAPQTIVSRHLHHHPRHEYGADNVFNPMAQEKSHGHYRAQLSPAPRQALHQPLPQRSTSNIATHHTKSKVSAVEPTSRTSTHGDPYVYEPASVPKPRNPATTVTAPRHTPSPSSLCDGHNHDSRHGMNAEPSQYVQGTDYGHTEKNRPRDTDQSRRASHTQTQSRVQTSPSIAVPGRARGRTIGNGVDVQAMIRAANAKGGSVNYVTQRYRDPEPRARLRKR